MKTISISVETYNRLQALARPFEDSPEDVIRALIDRCGKPGATEHRTRAEIAPETDGKELSSKVSDLVTSGGRVPHGTRLRAIYKGKEYLAEIRDGSVLWNSRRYASLSGAAVAVINSTGSDRPTEDGWRFWEFWDDKRKSWVSKADPKKRSW